MRKYLILGIAFFATLTMQVEKAAAQTVVLELFTSQGCSSCPPADALMKRLSAEDPDLLPLSMHVHYWDYLGWKDPYSSPGNTARQRGYAAALGDPQIFTPQLIVNGTQSVLGSDEASVRRAVEEAKHAAPAVDVRIVPSTQADGLMVALDTYKDAAVPEDANIWEITFDRYAKTDVKAGENDGRVLENINNVTQVKLLQTWPAAERHFLILLKNRPQGTAILVQGANEGRILGAAVAYGSAR